ncbi:MAG: (d)CMP kinase, partial [Clostridia bacterium]|nr:(d)CMP kinase [Clostridia bacterium]
RDKNDSEREISPLRKTDDSLLIDTSDMTFNEVVDKIKNLIKDVSL